MSKSIIRLSCYLAVVCGVSLRQIALLFSALFLMPITKSSIKRWMDDIGSPLPAPEEMLRHLLALVPVTECHLDGYYPLGTDHCVMVVKDEHDRILMPHEAVSENGDDARPFLQRLKDCGLKVTAVFSDYSQRGVDFSAGRAGIATKMRYAFGMPRPGFSRSHIPDARPQRQPTLG